MHRVQVEWGKIVETFFMSIFFALPGGALYPQGKSVTTNVVAGEVGGAFNILREKDGKLMIDDRFLKRLFSLPRCDLRVQLSRFLASDWGENEDTGVIPYMVFLYGDRLRAELRSSLDSPSVTVRRHAAKLLGATGNPADAEWARKQGARFPKAPIAEESSEVAVRNAVKYLQGCSEDFGPDHVLEGEVRNFAGNGFFSTVTFTGIHEGRTYGCSSNLFFRKEKGKWRFTHYFVSLVW